MCPQALHRLIRVQARLGEAGRKALGFDLDRAGRTSALDAQSLGRPPGRVAGRGGDFTAIRHAYAKRVETALACRRRRETGVNLPTQTGQPARYDYEYQRAGTANSFMLVEPLAGWRKVSVRATKTALDLAEEIKTLLDSDYPDAEKVVLIWDNLNTHAPAPRYKAFPPAEARRLLDRLEIHYTPKHGSWLDIAEI